MSGPLWLGGDVKHRASRVPFVGALLAGARSLSRPIRTGVASDAPTTRGS